ncbi:carboxypeptidase-like regulatory domain-containing protein [Chryseobacterium carnipullorum]|uniref:Carboxypeptidase-like regulatory domain-containing protein n=1 Tax=Chryseobacterium carnipullorum TaxID=1124835 RepID=A0A1M7F0X7_CHRCU|nr:carboxypeptidase-like regulatory domain-containing protein [Chryseobacterium carnipullorum]AZA49701.1 carboxypeptidase-like regulatory domain-containing protein [Chryseobacterium carnipullorum]AZA64592.1 carboxypeptidase-like regulatory domain-containing protein [Chryseobacterium carnipullorum]MDN5477352.1 carboxypeptidase-like regulatory domain-containing protein [Chryseobacterium sp.]SHL97685.1 CarboxypepD_reg-like domain-containing protein [Chryseobacterium carnipullorum]
MRFLFFYIFLGAFLNAQTVTGKVLSQYDRSPVPYARIGIDTEENGTIADEQGNYTLDLSTVNKDLNVTVAVGGFDKFSVPINSFLQSSTHIILLKEKVKDITEVTITPKRFKDKHWGVDSKSKKILFATYPERKKEKEEQSRELAIKFSNKRKVKIQKIHLNVADFQTDVPVELRINVYNEKDNLPNESVLYKDVTAVLTKDSIIDGTFTLDVSDYDIYVNSDFFVSIQFMNFFKGHIFLSGALLKTVFKRKYYGSWEKSSVASPAINIDVKVEK